METAKTTTNDENALKELDMIGAIARRATDMALKNNMRYGQLSAFTDISFAHEVFNLCLSELLCSDDSNFAHDIFGIRSHLDRPNRKFDEGFIPRYTQQS